jgi:hypothetical protein
MNSQRGLVQRVERKLEDVVGDALARLFGGAIVPEELEAALRREAADGVRSLEGNRLLAPNEYVITLSVHDYQHANADPDLTSDAFAKHLAGYIGEQGWETYGDVVVRFQQASNLHTGQVRARAAVNPDASPRPAANNSAAPQSDHAFSAESGATPMTDNPSYRGGPGWPGDDYGDYYDERQGRHYDDAQAGQEPRGPYPPEPGPYPPEPGGYPGQGGYPGPGGYPEQGPGGYPPPRPPNQGGYPDQRPGGYPPPRRPGPGGFPDYGGYPDQGPGGYPPPYEQRPPPGYGGPPGFDPGYRPPPGGYGPPPDYGEYGRPPARSYPEQGGYDYGAPPYGRPDYGQPDYGQPDYGQPDYGQPDYGQPDYGRYGEAPPGPPGYDYGPPPTPGYDSYGQGGYAAPTPTITLHLDDGSGRTYQLHEGTNVVGRGQDAQFRLPDTGVSRRHLEIRWDGQVALLSDLNSTNGTTVNNAPVQEWQLADGDVIRVGHSEIVVRVH